MTKEINLTETDERIINLAKYVMLDNGRTSIDETGFEYNGSIAINLYHLFVELDYIVEKKVYDSSKHLYTEYFYLDEDKNVNVAMMTKDKELEHIRLK